MSVLIQKNDSALGDRAKVIKLARDSNLIHKKKEKTNKVNMTTGRNRPTYLPDFNEIYTPTTRYDERKGLNNIKIANPYVIAPIPNTGETEYKHNYS